MCLSLRSKPDRVWPNALFSQKGFIPNKFSTTFRLVELHSKPPYRSTHGGETERTNLPLWSRAGIRRIFGNTCACKLPVRQCTELADGSKSPELADWAERQRCTLQGVYTFLLPLALRHDLYSRTFLWALRLVLFGCVQCNISIVVLYISLPLCMGENDISFQEDLLSCEYLASRHSVSRPNSLVWAPPTLWFSVTILLTHKVPHKVPQTLLIKVPQTLMKVFIFLSRKCFNNILFGADIPGVCTCKIIKKFLIFS